MASPSEEKRPNIVLILADDMGFSDIGCFGSEIRTPNLDKMAREGVRFSQMYNCARCCPTRASILTGLYPHQSGVGHMVGDAGLPGYRGFLNDNCVTLGEALGAAGYRTLYAGKWHASPGSGILDDGPRPGEPGNPCPRSRGFDRFYGTLAGCGNFWYPHALFNQDTPIKADDPDYYYTDVIGEKASEMIDEAVDADTPFFLHACYTAPHWPLHARPEDIERYRGKYRQGWDPVRAARHEELKGMGILDDRWPITARDPNSRDFASDDPARQEWEDLRMAVYAAQIDSLDQSIGRILETLERRGVADNTLVMFLSDNGGCAEFLNEDGDGSSWPGYYRYTARPGEVCTVGNIVGSEPGPATTFMSYDLPWANASNSPFRLYKHWVHEGGIATPFVLRWPERIREGGGLRHAPVHVVDFMATFLDAAGAAYPSEFNGNEITPLSGESWLPLLDDPGWRRDRPIFWEHEGNRAVRDGEWKLVSRHPEEWELYNMAQNRTETDDLAGRDPDRVARMAKEYGAWAERCHVVPWPPRKG